MQKKAEDERLTEVVRCPLPHPCSHSFWSKEAERKAEKQETVIQQNRMSKLHTENFDYADLNSNY